MNRPYIRQDGLILNQGDWLDIGVGVGKFRGVWHNPTLGLTTSLDHWRARLDPSVRDTMWLSVEKPSPHLEHATLVGGPLGSSGKAPRAFSEEHRNSIFRSFVREGWSVSRFILASTAGDRPTAGWTRENFGIHIGQHVFEATGPVAIATLTHLPTGARMASFANLSEAAEVGEISLRIGEWPSVTEIAEQSPAWKETCTRLHRSWAAAGFAQAVNFKINGLPILTKMEDGSPGSIQ